jgi:ABC-type antimicrobial peptide transport system permease subunit
VAPTAPGIYVMAAATLFAAGLAAAAIPAARAMRVDPLVALRAE